VSAFAVITGVGFDEGKALGLKIFRDYSSGHLSLPSGLVPFGHPEPDRLVSPPMEDL
jgi:hypothetical protein